MVRVSPSSPAVRPGVTPDGAAPDTGALPTVSPAPADDPRGLALGFTAYFVWGLLPLYMAVLAPAGALEIVVVRIGFALIAVPSSRRRRITVSSSRQKIRAKPMRTTTISRAPAGASTAM